MGSAFSSVTSSDGSVADVGGAEAHPFEGHDIHIRHGVTDSR
ncbi:hypothetical protein [Nocardia puris]|uniref:Uncharacterized protein n=1 Tax=Nocardia puris TaxID=208602 RepID=A0A366DHB9_9NOCA|nr:hypothetical protein [Nocardia puris]RBO89487.1 hypothetical protein DFR74_107165 [Nocardia puris]